MNYCIDSDCEYNEFGECWAPVQLECPERDSWEEYSK